MFSALPHSIVDMDALKTSADDSVTREWPHGFKRRVRGIFPLHGEAGRCIRTQLAEPTV